METAAAGFINSEQIGTVIIAVGALGMAAFGIVEGLKWLWIGVCGYGKLTDELGALTGPLENAYGTRWSDLLKAQYRKNRTGGDLRRTIRQGIRVGLTADNAAVVADYFAVVSAKDLVSLAKKAQAGTSLSPSESLIFGRFELAADARIDAALSLADNRYKGCARLWASGLAIGLSCLTAYLVAEPGQNPQWLEAFIIGFAAVPMAPIAKDVSTAIKSAATALKG